MAEARRGFTLGSAGDPLAARPFIAPARRRAALLVLAAVPTAALGATLPSRPLPLLVWNASASSPVGLYRVGSAATVRAGDMVLAWPPEEARALGAARGYLPGNVPLVKRVAAASGDCVCADGDRISVNGRRVVTRLRSDPAGRPMPWWRGCERLRGGDLFLLSEDVSLAFDGRYFGISRRERILGRASHIWPR